MTRPRIPPLPSYPRTPRGWALPKVGVRRIPLPGTSNLPDKEPAGEPPEWWMSSHPDGTKPEWAFWWGLMTYKKREGEDYIYHALIPGVGESYYSQLDFLFPDLGVGAEIQGLYWHYRSRERQTRDTLRAELMASRNVLLVFVDEDMVIETPRWIVQEAMAGRDHSRLAQRT